VFCRNNTYARGAEAFDRSRIHVSFEPPQVIDRSDLTALDVCIFTSIPSPQACYLTVMYAPFAWSRVPAGERASPTINCCTLPHFVCTVYRTGREYNRLWSIYHRKYSIISSSTSGIRSNPRLSDLTTFRKPLFVQYSIAVSSHAVGSIRRL